MGDVRDDDGRGGSADELAGEVIAYEDARVEAKQLPTTWGRGHALTPKERRRIVVRTLLRVAATIAVLVLGYSLIPFGGSERWTVATVAVAGLVVIAIVATYQIRSIAYATLPSVKAVETLSLLIPLVVFWFAATYFAQSAASPGSFDEQLDHVGAVYFAMTTITTIGYGDIAPVSDTARMMVMMQMVTNVLVVGLAVRLTMSAVRNNLKATPEQLAAREAQRRRNRKRSQRATSQPDT